MKRSQISYLQQLSAMQLAQFWSRSVTNELPITGLASVVGPFAVDPKCSFSSSQKSVAGHHYSVQIFLTYLFNLHSLYELDDYLSAAYLDNHTFFTGNLKTILSVVMQMPFIKIILDEHRGAVVSTWEVLGSSNVQDTNCPN